MTVNLFFLCVCVCVCVCVSVSFFFFSFSMSAFALDTNKFKKKKKSKFGAGMLIKCCILPSRNIKEQKLKGLCPRPRWGAHSVPPDPLAVFKPILCLVVFFIGPNCMRILLSPHF